MNPSYGNGMPSVPGGRPGVISSGPESGAVPPVAPASPVSMPGVGNSRSGGAKRGIIIGGILIVVALILGIAAVVVMRNRNNNGGNNSREVSFNELINYITSGEDVDTEIDAEYSAANNYYFLDGFETNAEKTRIYNDTKYLLDGFINGYQNGENLNLNNLVNDTKNLFDFLYVVELKDEVIDSEIFNIDEDAEVNYNTLKNRLTNYYDFSSLENNMYAESFKKVYENWIKSLTIRDGEDADFNSYRYVDRYYNMERNFVANVYMINAMMQGKFVAPEEETSGSENSEVRSENSNLESENSGNGSEILEAGSENVEE